MDFATTGDTQDGRAPEQDQINRDRHEDLLRRIASMRQRLQSLSSSRGQMRNHTSQFNESIKAQQYTHRKQIDKVEAELANVSKAHPRLSELLERDPPSSAWKEMDEVLERMRVMETQFARVFDDLVIALTYKLDQVATDRLSGIKNKPDRFTDSDLNSTSGGRLGHLDSNPTSSTLVPQTASFQDTQKWVDSLYTVDDRVMTAFEISPHQPPAGSTVSSDSGRLLTRYLSLKADEPPPESPSASPVLHDHSLEISRDTTMQRTASESALIERGWGRQTRHAALQTTETMLSEVDPHCQAERARLESKTVEHYDQRRQIDAEWEQYKEEIRSLYMIDHVALSRLRDLMNERYGFDKNMSQYKWKISQWGWRRNLPKNVESFVAKRRSNRARGEDEAAEFAFGAEHSAVDESPSGRTEIDLLPTTSALSSDPKRTTVLRCNEQHVNSVPPPSVLYDVSDRLALPGESCPPNKKRLETDSDISSEAESVSISDDNTCSCLPEECHAKACPPEEAPCDPIIAKRVSKIYELLNVTENDLSDNTLASVGASSNKGAKKAGRATKKARTAGKRRKSPDDSDDDNGGEGSPLDFVDSPSKVRKVHRLFACPVSKFDYRACDRWWSGYKRFCDVKQHLRRDHSDDVGRFKPSVGTSKTYEEMDQDLEATNNMSGAEKWRVCYRSLYHGSTEIPSPFLDTNASSLMEQNIQLLIDNTELSVTNTQLATRMRALVRHCTLQQHALEWYRRGIHESNQAPNRAQIPPFTHEIFISRDESHAAVSLLQRDQQVQSDGAIPCGMLQEEWNAEAPPVYVPREGADSLATTSHLLRPTLQSENMDPSNIADCGTGVLPSLSPGNAVRQHLLQTDGEVEVQLPSHPDQDLQGGVHEYANMCSFSDEGYGTGGSSISTGPLTSSLPWSAVPPDRCFRNETQDHRYSNEGHSTVPWKPNDFFGDVDHHGSYVDPDI